MNVTIMNACFYRDRHLIENANFVSLINEIEQKYAALREKALRLLSKGNRQNPRPMAEAKKVFEEMEESIDKMKRDRNTLTKYMKKIGFQLPSMQECFFKSNRITNKHKRLFYHASRYALLRREKSHRKLAQRESRCNNSLCYIEYVLKHLIKIQ